MAEARRLGLSYGKYVALVREGLIEPLHVGEEHSGTGVPGGDLPEPEERRCVICGAVLPEDFRSSRKTCSRECSAELNRRRNNGYYQKNIKFRATEKIPCLKCGELFLPNRKSQKFCGRVCQDSYNRARARARKNGGVVSDMAHRNYGPGKCPVCGTEYIKRSWNQGVCSWKCREALTEIKRRRGLC